VNVGIISNAAGGKLIFWGRFRFIEISTIYGLFGWSKGGQFAGFGTEEFLKSGRQLSSIRSGQNSRSSDG
jgi:hypothetical protein